MIKNQYVKYPSIPYLDANLEILRNPVQIFEKLDGGNCQIRKKDGRVIAGSRSNFLEGENVNRISWFRKFVSWVNTTPSLYNLDENFLLVGEWLAFHNIKYSPQHMDKFYLIDVFDLEEKKFIQYNDGVDLVNLMGIKVISPEEEPSREGISSLRLLRKGRVSKYDLDALLKVPSDYRNGVKEGIVVKDYEHQRFAKYLHPEFSEVASVNRNSSLVDKYVTQMRIKKTIYALTEEDNFSKEQIVTRIVRDVLTDQGVSLSRKDVEKKIKGLNIDKI